MKHKRDNKRFSVKGRGDYMTKANFIMKYYSDLDACKEFFFLMKWPTGYYCEKCGCMHFYFMKSKNCYRCTQCQHEERLLTNTCFQDCKLPLNKLLYGMFLIFTDKTSISSLALAEVLGVNYKTACLLQSKCRILMRNSNTEQTLDSSFYESDIAYIGTPSQVKQGMSTDKQAFLVILSTKQEHAYPSYVKVMEIEKDSGTCIEVLFKKFAKMDKDCVLNTDGKTTFNILKQKLHVKNEKIIYSEEEKKLCFLNKIISNFKSTILATYHGIGKRMMPLYFSEYEWRFNHRHKKNMLDKVCQYIRESSVMTRKAITLSLDAYSIQRGLVFA